jgi:ketosteroid isomerase-like protein
VVSNQAQISGFSGMPLAPDAPIPGLFAGGFMQIVHAGLLLMWLTLQPMEPVRVDWSRAAGTDVELTTLRDEYVAAVNASDAARTAGLYTTDALAMMCDGSLVRGADAIARRAADRTDEHAAVSLMPRRFSVAATVASETGTFTESIARPQGAASVEGVYVTVYVRQPGQPWRIALEVRTTGHAPALAVW